MLMRPGNKLNQSLTDQACQLIEQISDIFMLIDNTGIIVNVNEALEVILGWKPKEIIGSEVEILLSPELRSGHQVYRKNFYEQSQQRDMNELLNLTALHKKGYAVPVDIKLSFVQLGDETYSTAVVRDATKQRKLQKSLEENYQIIKQTLSEKNHLLGIAAHDMRNPIGIIQSYAQILLSADLGPLNDEQKEFLERIKQSSNFTMGLLEDVLDFSSIESGTMTLSKEVFNLNDLFNEIMPANKIYAKEKSIELKLNADSVEGLLIDADKRKLHQVFHNLINNGIKYSSASTKVNINVSKNGKKLVFSVEDHGVGIPKDDLDNLFQAFYRAKNKPTAGEKSTGLGLFITKRIVEAHNGKLFVNSVDGNGSIFSIELPIIKYE